MPADETPAVTAPAREEVPVAVFEAPETEALVRLVDNPPAPIASLSPFGRVDRVDGQCHVGVQGEYAGNAASGSAHAQACVDR